MMVEPGLELRQSDSRAHTRKHCASSASPDTLGMPYPHPPLSTRRLPEATKGLILPGP